MIDSSVSLVAFLFKGNSMNYKDLDERIVKLLEKRGVVGQNEVDNFLNPNIDFLLNPFDLNGMEEACEKIQNMINYHQKIVVYGDYDCDGISACAILYKYFKSLGADVDVYIPSRFDDGYGLSEEMIDEIMSKSAPKLLITVDLGITAIKEVELIKSYGTEVIVTDHHEPDVTLPNCTVIDPKVPGQKYAFSGLCGAAVALKLVQALAGKEEAYKYFDLAAVATIGDIVPLTNENRIIAKIGLEKIAKKECLASYIYMINQLNLEVINSQSVAFKIVPRLNASGRMSQGKKVFDFLIEEEKDRLKILYDDICKDNDERLESISKGIIALQQELKKVSIAEENIFLLKGEFHQGVLGILASRICHDYNKPTIIFTETEDGTLKGSGRSVDGVDLHKALQSVSDILIRFGGHKMAVGLEVKQENFNTLKERLGKAIMTGIDARKFLISQNYDIKITEQDINKFFIEQIELLEPFGCGNEKPTFMLEAKSLNVVQMKDNNYRHFKITTKQGKSIMCFAGEKHVEALKSDVKKQLIIDLENNYYHNKVYPQAILRDLFIKQIKIDSDKERDLIISLISRYNSEFLPNKVIEYNLDDIMSLIKKLSGNGFGTLVVVDSEKQAERMRNLYPKINGYTISHVPLKNGQNTILVSNRYPICEEDVCGYTNIIFTRYIYSHEKECFAQNAKVFIPLKRSYNTISINNSRNVNIMAYNILKKYSGAICANNIFEWLDKIQKTEGGLSKAQLMFSCLAFAELGFIKLNFGKEFKIEVVENPPKRELCSSKFISKITGRND